MDINIFKDTTILILSLTITSFLGVHFYEMGYCRFFKIPTEFISFELTNSGYLLFIFIAVFSVVSMLLDTYVSYILDIIKIKNKFLRALIIIGFIALLIFVFRQYLKSLTQQEILTLIGVFFFGFILTMDNLKPEIIEDKNKRYSINRFLSKKIGKILGPLFMIISIFCTLMFCIGFMRADLQEDFVARPDNKTVLLRKYDNIVIFGMLDSNRITQVIVERNYSQIDTLHVIKIK